MKHIFGSFVVLSALSFSLAAAPGNAPDGVVRGPFLINTIRATSPAGDNTTMKGIVVSLGPDQNKHLCYDEDLLRTSVGWTGLYLDFGNGQREIQHPQPPSVRGTPVFYTRVGPGWAKDGSFADPRTNHQGPLPRDWAKYRGLYRHGSDVILSYSVGDCAVLEMPGVVTLASGATAFTRTFNLGVSGTAQALLVASFPPGAGNSVAEVQGAGRGSVISVNGGAAPFHMACRVQDAPAGSALVATNDAIVLFLPALKEPAKFKVFIAQRAPDGNTFDNLPAETATVADLAPLTKGGPARWTKPVVTRGELGQEDGPYVVDTITAPFTNPWNARLFFGGFDFLPDGRAALGCFHSDVWLVSGLNDSLEQLTWKRFATGLFQPLGVKVVDGKIVVTCRDALVRLHDLNGDDEADYYEAVNNDSIVTPNYHEFCLDLQTDADGNFYYAKGAPWSPDAQSPHQGTMLKVSKDGSKLEVFATGLRAPNGSGLGPNGWLTVSDNQGHWMPASKLNLVKQGGFYGMVPTAQHELKLKRSGTNLTVNPSDPEARRQNRLRVFDTGTELMPEDYDQPICWLPMSMDNSSGGQGWVTSDKWGPFAGDMLFTSYGKGTLFHVMAETVDGVTQAGMSRFPLKFRSGTMRLRFNPQDGQLYACGLRGWQTDGIRDGSFNRVRYTGKPVHMAKDLHVTPEGLRITFTSDLDPDTAADVANWNLEQWAYLYSGSYGSPEFWPGNPQRSGHQPVNVTGAKLLDDKRTVLLQVPGLKPVDQMRIRFGLKAADGTPINSEIYSTIHKVPAG